MLLLLSLSYKSRGLCSFGWNQNEVMLNSLLLNLAGEATPCDSRRNPKGDCVNRREDLADGEERHRIRRQAERRDEG